MTLTLETPGSQETICSAWVTIGYLARLFRRSELTVHLWKRNDGLPYVRIPGDGRDTIRYELRAVMRWARERGQRVYPMDVTNAPCVT